MKSEFEEPLPDVDDAYAKPVDKRIFGAIDGYEEDLRVAVETEGEVEVGNALEQVATGEAHPEALIAWIDDLRDPEFNVAVVEDPNQTGVIADFVADTELAYDQGNPGAAAAAAAADDASYFVPTARRKGGDDDADFGGGGGGGNGDGNGGGGGGNGDDARPVDAAPELPKPSAKPAAKVPAPAPAAPAPAPAPAKPPGGSRRK